MRHFLQVSLWPWKIWLDATRTCACLLNLVTQFLIGTLASSVYSSVWKLRLCKSVSSYPVFFFHFFFGCMIRISSLVLVILLPLTLSLDVQDARCKKHCESNDKQLTGLQRSAIAFPYPSLCIVQSGFRKRALKDRNSLRATSGSFPGPGNLTCPSNFRPESHGQYRVVATTPSRLSYSHRRARRRPAASTTCVRTSRCTSGSIFLFLSENRVLPFSLFLCLSVEIFCSVV